MGRGDIYSDRGYYNDSAAICRNGHLINDAVSEYPDKNRNFCGGCGAEVLLKCESCNNSLIGKRFYDGVATSKPTFVPKYCEHCGKTFPWTEAALIQADELIDLIDDLTEEQKAALKSSFPDLIADRPGTQVAALRTGNLMKNVGENFKTALRDILVGLATESAKSLLRSHGFPF